MGPDWFTVIAQIVNFLVLVALLKRFLYGPVMRAMDRREAEISSRLESAARMASEAEREKARYEEMTRELAEQGGEMRAKAREDADALRGELLGRAREEAEKTREQWLASLRRERESLILSLERHVCEQTCSVARAILAEMADSTLEERMAACLERRIQGMSDHDREELSRSLCAAGSEIVVRSAFELNREARDTLLRALNSVCVQVEPRFDVEPSLVCGIEIVAAGRALTWTLEDHLGSLEERLMDAIGKEAGGSRQSQKETDRHGS